MPRTRWMFLVVALVALTLVAAACGGDDDDEDTDPTPTEVSTQPTDTAPEPTATSAPDPTPADAAPTATEVSVPPPANGASTRVDLVAQAFSFSPGVIEAPAGASFTIALDNRDQSVGHNVAIYSNQDEATGGGQPIAASPVEPGPSQQELAVPALDAGDYFIWCQVHTSTMTATLEVEG